MYKIQGLRKAVEITDCYVVEHCDYVDATNGYCLIELDSMGEFNGIWKMFDTLPELVSFLSDKNLKF